MIHQCYSCPFYQLDALNNRIAWCQLSGRPVSALHNCSVTLADIEGPLSDAELTLKQLNKVKEAIS